MWRHALKLPLPKLFHTFKSNTKRLIKTVRIPTTFFTLNTLQLINADLPENIENEELNDLEIANLRFTEEVKMACQKSDQAICDLLMTLNACIDEICEQYQHCVAKQIEITLVCMNLDPVGKHWDELTKYRVEADELRVEFEKYGMLVDRIGQIVYNQAFSTIIAGNTDGSDAVASQYESLKTFVHLKVEENQYWDNKLLDVNAKSILNCNF